MHQMEDAGPWMTPPTFSLTYGIVNFMRPPTRLNLCYHTPASTTALQRVHTECSTYHRATWVEDIHHFTLTPIAASIGLAQSITD